MTRRDISNERDNVETLIANMIIKKATPSEIMKAVKYSMAVIDLEKSYHLNDIEELKLEYMEGE